MDCRIRWKNNAVRKYLITPEVLITIYSESDKIFILLDIDKFLSVPWTAFIFKQIQRSNYANH